MYLSTSQVQFPCFIPGAIFIIFYNVKKSVPKTEPASNSSQFSSKALAASHLPSQPELLLRIVKNLLQALFQGRSRGKLIGAVSRLALCTAKFFSKR